MPERTPAILLIEDDLSTRELYKRELSRFYEVFTCESESEALTLLHNHFVSAIILEPALRNGQGWSFLAMLRSMTQTSSIPIILCSTLDERRRGMELGATQCLIKPVLPVALQAVIHKVIFKPSSN